MTEIEYVRRLKGVSHFTDRHGKRRFRFRKQGAPTYYFKARPGSRAFEAEYKACLKQAGVVPLLGGAAVQPDVWVAHSTELVYFIGARKGPVKIGRTRDVNGRLAALQTGTAAKLYIFATAPGGIALERAYHRLFAEHRLEGEWFARVPAIKAEIRALVRLTHRANLPAANRQTAEMKQQSA